MRFYRDERPERQQLREHRGLISATGAYFQNILVSAQLQSRRRRCHHQRLGNGLIVPN